MLPTRSVLLDLDGTLIDSQPGILASRLAALRALGHKPDENLDIKRAIGPLLEDIMQVLLRPYGDDRVDEAVVAYRQHYGESGLLESSIAPAPCSWPTSRQITPSLPTTSQQKKSLHSRPRKAARHSHPRALGA